VGSGLVARGDAGGRRTLWGDAAALASSALCGLYTAIVAKVAPTQERLPRVLGFLGLWNMIFCFPLLLASCAEWHQRIARSASRGSNEIGPPRYCAEAPGARCLAPLTPTLCGWVLVKGCIDNVLADLR